MDDTSRDRVDRAARDYWRHNVRYVFILLSIWFAVSYGAGILFVEPLNAFRIPGTFPCRANSRSMMRDTRNFRYTARLRPVRAQRFRIRVGLALRGSRCRAA